MLTELFAASVKDAINGALDVVGLVSRAEALKRGGEARLAIELYRIWLGHNRESPVAYAVGFNCGVLLSEQDELQAAHDMLVDVTRLKPDFMPAYINLGTVLERMGHKDVALAHWMHVVSALAAVTPDAIGNKVAALKQAGRMLEGAAIFANAEMALQQCVELDQRMTDALQHWLHIRQNVIKSPAMEPFAGLSRADIVGTLSPLSAAVLTEDPWFQLANAHRYHQRDVARPDAIGTVGAWPVPAAPRDRRLRVAYLSSDLREHAVGFLTSEVFELHDRNRLEVFALYCGPVADDATQRRIKNAVEHWVDLSKMDDKQVASRMVEAGIDILVDLNGYSRDARLTLFPLRPAPIVVNWLGFPGTSGSPNHHYLIADPYIVPEGCERHHSETVLRLPCYQPTDRQRTVAAHRPSRAEAGLPETGTVFCCFNGTQKMNRHAVGRWMAILHGVPDSVLWVLASTDVIEARLLQLATEHGIDPARIVFAPKRANPDHLARYPLADLFLDTSPYGAHTTASDAMWMGVPVLTLPGRSFASRVCASLVRSAGLPELVCASPAEYVERGIALGRDPAALAALKARLRDGRDDCTLFDTPGLVRALEAHYERMWDDYAAGRLPRPDMTNLDQYRDIGAGLDHEAGDIGAVPDYDELYRLRLAYKDGITPLARDPRLWTGDLRESETA